MEGILLLFEGVEVQQKGGLLYMRHYRCRSESGGFDPAGAGLHRVLGWSRPRASGMQVGFLGLEPRHDAMQVGGVRLQPRAADPGG